MPILKTVLGLDMGSYSVKAVELRQTFRDLEPGPMREMLRGGEGEDAEALRRFATEHALHLDNVVTALPGDHVTARRFTLPFRDRKRLSAAVPFEVEGEIPFPLEDVLVDWELVGGDRGHAEVAALVATRSEVARWLESFTAWGCEPRVVEAEGLVLANLAGLFDLPGTRLLLDVGHRKTTLCLAVEGRGVFARTVPIGGAALTQAIAKDRDWSGEEAERSKCEDGLFELGFETHSPGATAVLDRLSREIVRTLESQEDLLGAPVPQSGVEVVLMGGTARLHRLDEFLCDRTGLRCNRLVAAPSGEGTAIVAGGDPLVYAPALALALRGTARSRSEIDFRQGEFAYRTDLRRYFGPDLRWTAIGAGVALLLLLARGLVSVSLEAGRADALEQQIAGLYAEAFPGKPIPDRPVAALRREVDSAQARAEFLGIYGNGSALDLLAELSRRVPDDLEVQFEEISVDGRAMRIKVFAKNIQAADRLERVLAASPPFTRVKAGEIVRDAKRGGQSFDLTVHMGAEDEP